MTDKQEPAGQAEVPEGPGNALRRARESRGLKVIDVAKSLHLDAWMIEALEENDFDALGAPVFAKGHMRQYGSLLGLETDDLMIAYYRVRGRADAPPPPITATMARPAGGRGMLVTALLIAAVVLIALGALLWYIGERSDDSLEGLTGARETPALQTYAAATDTIAVAGPPALRPVADDGDGMAAGGADSNGADTVISAPEAQASEAGAQPLPSGGAASDATAAAPSIDATQAPVPTEMQLRLSFGGESWVEVYDADGERLLYNMVAAGRTRTVTGRPPLEVYLGRSGEVELQVDGAPFQIPAQSVRGNTARFRIGTDRRPGQ